MNLKELREIAKAATPGPWYAYAKEARAGFNRWFVPTEVPDEYRHQVASILSDSEFIATFNPKLVLDLLDKIERMEQSLKVLTTQQDIPKWVRDYADLNLKDSEK